MLIRLPRKLRRLIDYFLDRLGGFLRLVVDFKSRCSRILFVCGNRTDPCSVGRVECLSDRSLGLQRADDHDPDSWGRSFADFADADSPTRHRKSHSIDLDERPIVFDFTCYS